MHIRLKVPQELHAALKVEAAIRGVTLEKLCVERLSQERGVMPIDPANREPSAIAVTGEHRAVETSAIAG